MELQYKDKIDIGYIWMRHMDRVNTMSAAQDEGFDAYVRQQFRLLPSAMRKWVWDQKDAFMKTIMVLVYKDSGLGPIGYEDNPMVWNHTRTELGLSNDPGFKVKRDEDGNIDWGDPGIYSPKIREQEYTDYETFNMLILTAAEKAQLSWPLDEVEQDAGDTEEYIKRKKTPFFYRDIKPSDFGGEDEEDEEEGDDEETPV